MKSFVYCKNRNLKEVIRMATSSFTTELKFDTEEKVSSFLEAIENAKNNKLLDIDVEYEFIKGNDIKKFFEETSEKKGE